MTPDTARDAHQHVLRWSHVLVQQVDRLYADREEVVKSQEKVSQAGFFGHDDAWPFYMLEADKHFALVAGRQLLRALQAFDGNDRLPQTLLAKDVRLVRDALEHWDEPAGRANSAMRDRGTDPNSHHWTREGPGVLGDTISDTVLRGWAAAVYSELVMWNPW